MPLSEDVRRCTCTRQSAFDGSYRCSQDKHCRAIVDKCWWKATQKLAELEQQKVKLLAKIKRWQKIKRDAEKRALKR